MSSGLNCEFVEPSAGKWYYLLEQWSAPKCAWDWREYADAYGPFTSQENADEHLAANHSNPGGAEITRADNYRADETYAQLFKRARV